MDKKIILFLCFLSTFVLIRIAGFYYFKPVLKVGQQIYFTSALSSQPKIYNSYQNFMVNLPNGDPIFIKTNSNLELNYADRILIVGSPKYKLLNKRQILMIENPKISLDNSVNSQFLAVVDFIRQQISNVFSENLPKDLAGLLLGIVIGVKTNMSNDFSSNLKLSGVTHVIAASGMNVTLVGGFVFAIFASFLKRRVAVVISIFMIIFYTFLAGFQPSIIRASIMGIILFASQISGRQNYSLYSLALTFLIMVFIWPQLLTDIGFQLSFAATLGIMFVPFAFGKPKNILPEDLATTVSAQIATLPILLANFGMFSLWSVVVNLLLLWMIPPLMILGGLAALSALIFAPLSKLFLLACLPLLAFFETVVNYFAQLSGIIRIDQLPFSLVAGYYLLLISIIIFKIKRNKSSS